MFVILNLKYMFCLMVIFDLINKKYLCGKKLGYWVLGIVLMCVEIKFLFVNIFL